MSQAEFRANNPYAVFGTLAIDAPADVRATWADISRAKELLDWSPRTEFAQGLDQCVDWYLAERSWAKTIDTSD